MGWGRHFGGRPYISGGRSRLLPKREQGGGLEVSAVTVENVIELSGAEFDATGHSSERFVMDVGATPVDVTLKNNGRAALTIKKIQAQLINEVSKRDSYVKNCAFSGGGPAAITAEYALSLPVDSSGELTKQLTLTDTEFKIEPGSVERLSVTIGPGEDSFYSLRVIEVGLRLIQDDNQEVNLPNIVLITPRITSRKPSRWPTAAICTGNVWKPALRRWMTL